MCVLKYTQRATSRGSQVIVLLQFVCKNFTTLCICVQKFILYECSMNIVYSCILYSYTVSYYATSNLCAKFHDIVYFNFVCKNFMTLYRLTCILYSYTVSYYATLNSFVILCHLTCIILCTIL